MRRIITGHDEAGRSVFRSAEPFTPTVTSPRVDWFEAWATCSTAAATGLSWSMPWNSTV